MLLIAVLIVLSTIMRACRHFCLSFRVAGIIENCDGRLVIGCNAVNTELSNGREFGLWKREAKTALKQHMRKLSKRCPRFVPRTLWAIEPKGEDAKAEPLAAPETSAKRERSEGARQLGFRLVALGPGVREIEHGPLKSGGSRNQRLRYYITLRLRQRAVRPRRARPSSSASSCGLPLPQPDPQ